MILPETVLQDLRYGVRMLRRSAGFSMAAVAALALGIGVNTAMFTAYQAMIARQLDARDPATMVNLALLRNAGGTDFTFSYPDYEAYRDSAHSFSGVIAFSPEHMRLSNAGAVRSEGADQAGSLVGRLGLLPSETSNAEIAFVFGVSENYFKVMGVPLLLGRGFDAINLSEMKTVSPVLVSENYWQRRFGRDPAVLGKSVRLNGLAVTIVGVTPHDFVGTSVAAPDFWLPLSLEPLVHADAKWLLDRENKFCRLFARLAPGAQMGQAQAEMSVLADRLRKLHEPHTDSARAASALVWPGSPFPRPLNTYPGLRLAIALIGCAGGMVLLVACSNVASLQLARARSRQNELQTRLSLGASRLRVIRQLLTESALLGLIAGGLALLCSWAFLKASVTLASEAFPAQAGTFILDVSPRLAIFTYVFSISMAAGILFGLAPALESSRRALYSSVRGGTASHRSRRLQDFLVVAQVALSLVLMIAGSTFIRSAVHAVKMDPGYDSKHVVELRLQFPEGVKYTAEHKVSVTREVRRRMGELPAVAAITDAWSPGDLSYQTAVVAIDAKSSAVQGVRALHYNYVQANYFQTLGIALIAGRTFGAEIGETSVVLSESAAKQLWPGQNPLARSLRLGATDERFHDRNELLADGLTYQVIGVVRDVRGFELDGSDSQLIYLPLRDGQAGTRPILLRTEANAAQVLKRIEPLIASIDPEVEASISTLDEMLRQGAPFITSSLAAAVASTTGFLGLVLALLGIYGTVSYIVVLRTQEIGIRMAIGAQKHNIFGLILLESSRPVMVGLLIGMSLAVGVSYVLRGLLFGVKPVDAISFGIASTLFLAITLLAIYPPSRRAVRIDPMAALRYE